MEELNRRQFLKGAASAAVLHSLPSSAEAQEKKFDFLPSTLSQKEIDSDKQRAATSLAASIPNIPSLKYLRDYVPYLEKESQMYIPSPEEIQDVILKSAQPLQALSAQIQINGTGIFIFADYDKAKGHTQRLYTLRKKNAQSVQFLKAYAVSLAEKGFGNEEDSGKTPLGLHKIISGTQGYFGEVVSGLNKYKDLFNRVKYRGKDHWFVKGFGTERGNDAAEVVTDEYMIVGPQTKASRGIRIHGTNRSGAMGPNGAWTSFLGGARRSGGCIRASNTDIRDMTLSGYTKVGNFVMIHTTESARDISAENTQPLREIEKETPPPTPVERKRPRRWNE